MTRPTLQEDLLWSFVGSEGPIELVFAKHALLRIVGNGDAQDHNTCKERSAFHTMSRSIRTVNTERSTFSVTTRNLIDRLGPVGPGTVTWFPASPSGLLVAGCGQVFRVFPVNTQPCPSLHEDTPPLGPAHTSAPLSPEDPPIWATRQESGSYRPTMKR